MKLYLLESYPPNMEFGKDFIVIALTPEACYQLGKDGVKYSIPEDYYVEQNSILPKEFINLCSRWTARIDEVLYAYVEEIREHNLKLAELYEFYFCHRVLEQLLSKCFTINKIFETLKPSTVIFATCCSGNTTLDPTFHSTGQSYYSQIIPVVCKGHSITLQRLPTKSLHTPNSTRSILVRLSQSRTLQNMRFAAKYLVSPTVHNSPRKLNIFLPKNTHIGLDSIIDATKRGHNVYGAHNALTSDDVFIDSTFAYIPFGTRKFSRLNLHPTVSDSTDRILGQSELATWFNEYFHTDVSSIILPRLRHFILNICPWVVAYYRAYLEFYKEARIDTLIMAHDALPRESAALLAARHLELNTVCVSHGDGVYSCRGWEAREVHLYKTIIASNPERKEYYEQLGARNVHVSPHRLYPQLKLKDKRKCHKTKHKVIYLTTFINGDNRGLDGGAYSDTWLYTLQKALVEYFATRVDYSFIFEAMPASDLLYNPIVDFIRDNKFSNVLYSTKPFLSHLKCADRIICDIPSTGLYEAVVAGVPTMSLYRTDWTYRQSAINYFGNLLKSFSTIPEAITRIDDFLNDDPNKYTMNLNTGNDSILDILENKCQ